MSRKRWLSLHHHLVLAIVLVGLLTALVPVSVAKPIQWLFSLTQTCKAR